MSIANLNGKLAPINKFCVTSVNNFFSHLKHYNYNTLSKNNQTLKWQKEKFF